MESQASLLTPGSQDALAVIIDRADGGQARAWTVVDGDIEHTGTVEFPADERGPARFEWDGEPPENWEEIEEAVLGAAAAGGAG